MPVGLISVCPVISSGGRHRQHKLATGLIIKVAEHEKKIPRLVYILFSLVNIFVKLQP